MTFGTGVLVLCLDDRGGMNVGSLIYRLNLTTHCDMGHEWACYPVRQSASHLCPQLDSLQSAATQWGHFSGLPAGHEFHFTIQDSKDLEVFASNTLGLLIVGNYVLVWVRFESWFYLLIEHYGNATNKQLKKKEKKKKKVGMCCIFTYLWLACPSEAVSVHTNHGDSCLSCVSRVFPWANVQTWWTEKNE